MIQFLNGRRNTCVTKRLLTGVKVTQIEFIVLSLH